MVWSDCVGCFRKQKAVVEPQVVLSMEQTLTLDTETPFNDSDIEMLTKTWVFIQPVKERIALDVFVRLFQKYTDQLRMVEAFHYYCDIVDKNNAKDSERILSSNQTFRNHAFGFVCVIEKLMKLLDTEEQETLEEDCAKLLREEMRDILKSKQAAKTLCELAQFCELDGQDLYAAIQNSWGRILLYIHRRMKEGFMRYRGEGTRETIRGTFNEMRKA